MLFEAWCVALRLPPCGRPALRSLGCLCGSAARGDGVGVVRHETMKRTPSEPGFASSAAAPAALSLSEGALPAGSLAGVRRTSVVAWASLSTSGTMVRIY